MRQEFAADIEKELRLLEEYVIDNADPTKVGENLLADVLGPNAVYTQFTAAARPPETPYGITHPRPAEESTLAPHGQLHALPTRILASTPSAPQPSDLHVQETKILTMPHDHAPSETEEATLGNQLHELETKVLAMPTHSIHDLETKILKREELMKPSLGTDAQTMPAPPKVVVGKPDGGEVDEEEPTPVALQDDDLEPV
jgi:hypothetical protein